MHLPNAAEFFATFAHLSDVGKHEYMRLELCRAVDAIRETGTNIGQICAMIGVPRRTLGDWRAGVGEAPYAVLYALWVIHDQCTSS